MSAATHLLQTNPKAADQQFQQILAQTPNDRTALTGHMEALAAQGQRGQAADVARQLLAADPGNKAAAAALASYADLDHADSVVGRLKKMAGGFMRGPADDGGQNAAQNGAMKALSTGGGASTPLAATAAASRGAALPPPAGPDAAPYKFSPLVLKAIRKEQVGDYTGALLDVSQAIDADPNDTAAWIVRAEADNQLESYPAAIKAAAAALALDPANARALRARAYAELESGQAQSALTDAARAVALDPANGLGFLYLAMAEDATGMRDAAVRDLRKAIALDPNLEPLSRMLARKLGIAEAPAPAGAPPKTLMVRGGLIATSLALVLFGLIGSRRGRRLTRAITTRPPRDAEADIPGEIGAGALLAGNYRVVRELGRGGMGVVYEGVDETLQRRVAIKRLLRDPQSTEEDAQRFLREARLVAQLKHPNLAQIYNVLPGNEPLLVFEYVDGKTLDESLRLNGKLPVPIVRRLVGEIAGALAAAHERGIIHRDLKPGNVMIAVDGTAKVMDFGIAHQAKATATRMTQTVACGTPPYMPPEQAMGSVSKASDLYSLGVMAYELLTGRRPFDGPDYLEQKIQRRYVKASERAPGLTAAFDAFFEAALDPDPTKRPAGAAAFAAAFERACDATPRQASLA